MSSKKQQGSEEAGAGKPSEAEGRYPAADLRKALRVLERADELLEERSGWTRHEWARDRHSRPVTITNPRAARYCLGGAVFRAGHELLGVELPDWEPAAIRPPLPLGIAFVALVAVDDPCWGTAVSERVHVEDGTYWLGEGDEARFLDVVEMVAALNDSPRRQFRAIRGLLEEAQSLVRKEIASRRKQKGQEA